MKIRRRQVIPQRRTIASYLKTANFLAGHSVPIFLQKIQDLFSDGIARSAANISRPVDEHKLRGDLEPVVSELEEIGSLRRKGGADCAPFATLGSTASAASRFSSSTTCSGVSARVVSNQLPVQPDSVILTDPEPAKEAL